MHDRDLPRRPAEAQQRDPHPDAERGAERHAVFGCVICHRVADQRESLPPMLLHASRLPGDHSSGHPDARRVGRLESVAADGLRGART